MGMVGDEVNVDELGDIDWEEENNDSEEEFAANYEVDDKNDDKDLAGSPAVQNKANAIVSQQPFGVPPFMRTLDLKAMHAPKFLEYVNTGEGNIAAEDGEFSVGIEFGSRDSVISVIKSYTIIRGVDYIVYESEPQTFYAKCKGHIGSNFLRRFKAPYLHKLVVNTESFRRAGNIVVNRFDRRNEMFEVCEMQDGTIYTVNLAQRHCDFGHFQVEQLPCRHVLVCCANQSLDWQVYVHDVYKMSKICKVYRGEFVPMGDPSAWDRYKGTKVIANWTLRHVTKRRPKSTRYLSEMDLRDMRSPRQCTICGREGHSRSRCPQCASPSSAGGD
ncbi:hypothetical protein Ahy_B10g103996 [Arachis hypogaea]|uniref:CCHC-type domain-containing protein n=1 Tax=Arachis hypogaea TaxID=3818 RepID=A0A444X4H7_ARAHY|nr:hypothetical protein Ahy_B10g103996 [Arachis hypogaea]